MIHKITALSITAQPVRYNLLPLDLFIVKRADAIYSRIRTQVYPTWDGIGTKKGCLAAEAIIFFKPEMVGNFPFLHKRSGQLLSKMRFISSQLNAYVSDDVWIKNAKHANAMGKKLSQGLLKHKNIVHIQYMI